MQLLERCCPVNRFYSGFPDFRLDTNVTVAITMTPTPTSRAIIHMSGKAGIVSVVVGMVVVVPMSTDKISVNSPANS